MPFILLILFLLILDTRYVSLFFFFFKIELNAQFFAVKFLQALIKFNKISYYFRMQIYSNFMQIGV